MCDDAINPWAKDPNISRRSLGIGVGAAFTLAAAEAAAQAGVTEKNVMVKTPAGESDCALYYPAGRGPWPGVIIWPDIGGIRPVMRDMGKRLAAQGYTVLVVNPFYRSAREAESSKLNFGDPAGRAALGGYRAALVAGQGPFDDAKAYVAFLDAQAQTDKKKMIGVQGYCMGGPLSFQTAGAVPNRIGAVGSFHGGGLVTTTPESPHLLVAKTKAAYLVAVAKNDDARAPNDKEVLKKTFAETGKKATVEVYAGDHGWCVPGSAVYNQAEAERAWAELSKMYKASLV